MAGLTPETERRCVTDMQLQTQNEEGQGPFPPNLELPVFPIFPT